MAKLKSKQSKRQPGRLRYKIQKKIRQHNKKNRREAKKNPKKTKQEMIQIPNICPFKENILKEVEAMKKFKEEERQKQREEFLARKEDENKNKTLEGLVKSAETREKVHSILGVEEQGKNEESNKESSLKAYFKEFKKVVEAADVVLEVVDARDPLGTRCVQVEETVKELQGKKLVLVLNKADLVPRTILDQWLKYLRKSLPVVAFKASTQNQSRRLGQKKMGKQGKMVQGSACIGAELVLSLLGNYCRNKGIKTSIRVGVVGLPNVGKSSLINSLKRSRACNVGATPGVTKSMQEVQLDSKIKLLDCPGIVFSSGSDASASLRNAVKVSQLADPITPANAILQRVGKQQIMKIYDVVDFQTPDEFYSLKASRDGRFKKGGVPDAVASARSLLEDWNSGKIKYYTVPPEETTEIHISSSIVTEEAKEFQIEDFHAMELEVLDQLNQVEDAVETESLGPVEKMEDEEAEEQNGLLGNNIEVQEKPSKKKTQARLKKLDPEMMLEGNLQLNQIKKKEFKKQKKLQNRKIKAQLDESYDFKTDFN